MSTKLSRREFLRLAGLAGAGVALAACQPAATEAPTQPPTTEEEVVPTLVNMADVTGELRIGTINDASVNAVMDILLAGFGAKYPNVKTKIEYQIGDYTERLFTQAAAGTLPDVVWNANLFTPGFVENKVLKDLMPFIDVDEEFDLDDVYPAILGEARVGEGLYYLPASLDVVTMYYNKTMLEAAGASLPTADWTWADFLQAGLKVIEVNKDAEGNPTQWMLDNATWNWSATVHPWLVGYGSDTLSEDGKTSSWSSPESIEALTAYTEMWTKHKIAQPLGMDVGGQAFPMGKAATFFHIAGLRKSFRETIADKFEWDVELVPKMPNGKHNTGMGSYGFGIFEKAIMPQVAWDFIKYLNMPTAQLIMAKNMAGIPLLKSLANDERWLSFLTPPPTNNAAFVKAADDGVFSKYYPVACGGFYTGVVSQSYQAALESAIRGEKDVETAFKEVDEKIQVCLDENA